MTKYPNQTETHGYVHCMSCGEPIKHLIGAREVPGLCPPHMAELMQRRQDEKGQIENG